MLDLALCKAELFLPTAQAIHEFVVRLSDGGHFYAQN